ncbi:MAG: hypothetical protein Q4B70_18930, partial [Lachnospiraceae bacterium]|nr:hypothetical protein [Lachnospiraceae bacterium]
MKKVYSLVIIILCVWCIAGSGCEKDYSGVWYGLNESTLYYDGYNNDYIPKLVLKEDYTYSSDSYNSGTYYVSDEIIFLEPDESYLRELTISNRSSAAAKLDFQDKGTGTVIIANEATDSSNYATLYYPNQKEWQKAWEKLGEQRTGQLKETLEETLWCAWNEDLSIDLDSDIYDTFEFDGFSMSYCLSVIEEDEGDNGKLSVLRFNHIEERTGVWDYEVIDFHTIRLTDTQTGEQEDVYCDKYIEYLEGDELECLQLTLEGDELEC